MADKGPVEVTLTVTWPGGHETEEVEIDRAEWDSMSPAERVKLIDYLTDEMAANSVSSGWDIADEDDMAEADDS